MSRPAPVPPVSHDALINATNQWTEEFGRRFKPELEQAVREYEHAILGGPPFGAADIEELRSTRSTLPAIWAAFWRPMADGSTGGALAARSKKLGSGVLGAAVARLRQARVIYGDVAGLEGEVAHVRDRVLGDEVKLRLKAPMPAMTPRHLRLLGVVVDIGGGRFEHPSVILGNLRFSHVPLPLLSARLGEEVRELGHDPGPDEDVPSRLLRWVGVAHGLLRRLGGRSEEAALEEEELRWPDLLEGATTQAETLSRLEAALDKPVDELGGSPRALSGEAEGAKRVEAWLRGLERRGLLEGPVRYLDLDPVRRSLGLPPLF